MYSIRRHLLAQYAKAVFGSKSGSGIEGVLSSSSYCFGDGKLGLGGRILGVQQCGLSVGDSSCGRRHYSGKAQRLITIPFGQPTKFKVEPFLRRHQQFRYNSQSSDQQSTKKKEAASSSSNLEEERRSDEDKLEESELDNEEDGGGSDMEGYDEGETGSALYLTDEQLKDLSSGDPEVLKKIKYCQLEYEVFREEGGQVPLRLIKLRDWDELLTLDSRTKRRKYLLYLFKNEMKRESNLRKKEEQRQKRLQEYADNPLIPKEEDIYGMCYSLARNTLFLRLYDTTVNKLYNQRLCTAISHQPPLIMDLSYDEFMNPRESKNCAKQLELVITENRTHKEPFNLHFCNAGRNTPTMKYLRKMIPVLDDDSFVINIHEGCFTDLFPKKNLVYLTPHTRDDLDEYDEDDIYIVGAMVDKSNPRPYSFAKAKKLGIRMRRLPLDKHVMWGIGGKSLTLNQVVRIMLDTRYSRGDWKEGLKCLPMRKLCRDFHPYPDQIEEGKIVSSVVSPYRKEKMSSVFQDNELLNRRKGFRRSDAYSPNRPNTASRIAAPKMRSLLYDYDK